MRLPRKLMEKGTFTLRLRICPLMSLFSWRVAPWRTLFSSCPASGTAWENEGARERTMAAIPAKKVESKECLRSMNCSYHSGNAEKNLFSVTGRRP